MRARILVSIVATLAVATSAPRAQDVPVAPGPIWSIERLDATRAALDTIDELTSSPRHELARSEFAADVVRGLAGHLTSLGLANDDSEGARRTALVLLERLGREARDALPALTALLQTAVAPRLQTRLLDAFAAIAPWSDQDHEPLLAALERFRQLNQPTPVGFLRAWVRVAEPVAAPLQDLVAALADDNVFVRELAAERLGADGPAARAALNALAETLLAEHRSEMIMRGPTWATMFVGRYDHAVRRAVATAMIRIDAAALATAHAYAWFVRNGDTPATRLQAVVALGIYGPAAGSEADALCHALDDVDVRVVREAVTALGMLGPAAGPAAAAALRARLDDADRQVARRAAAALSRVEN